MQEVPPPHPLPSGKLQLLCLNADRDTPHKTGPGEMRDTVIIKQSNGHVSHYWGTIKYFSLPKFRLANYLKN